MTAVQKRISKRVMFSAAHHIPGAGKCENNHGHNWRAHITVDQISGQLDKRGFIVDVRDLKSTAFKYDHGDLNDHFESPTTEVIAQQIADDALELCKQNNDNATFIVNVHLDETDDNSADASASNFVTNFGFDQQKMVQAPLQQQVKKAHDDEAAYAFGGGNVPPAKTKFVKRTK